MESVAKTTSDYRLLFIASDYDLPMLASLEEAGADYITTDAPECGQYAKKINHGYRNSDEPLLFLGADDLRFHPGWFEACVQHLTPGVGVVGTNDLCNRRTIKGPHSTHSLVTRDYIDQYGTIDEPRRVLHEGYQHEWVDDELVGTARHRHAYVHVPNAIVEHLHPMVDKAPLDELYAAQGDRMAASRELYQQRRRLWR